MLKYRSVLGDNPRALLEQFEYQKELTEKLDTLDLEKFDRKLFYEIILWKLNRFPIIEDQLINELRRVKKICPKEHREVKEILRQLLCCKGISLPMASTILRFLNPKTFQIIDDRAYRAVYDKRAAYPSKPREMTEKFLRKSEEIYFKYLDDLHQISDEYGDSLPFNFADRILYLADIEGCGRFGDWQ